MANEFNNAANNVLKLAQEVAVELKHSVLGTEHILLGLMLEKDSIASQILRKKVKIEEVEVNIGYN